MDKEISVIKEMYNAAIRFLEFDEEPDKWVIKDAGGVLALFSKAELDKPLAVARTREQLLKVCKRVIRASRMLEILS